MTDLQPNQFVERATAELEKLVNDAREGARSAEELVTGSIENLQHLRPRTLREFLGRQVSHHHKDEEDRSKDCTDATWLHRAWTPRPYPGQSMACPPRRIHRRNRVSSDHRCPTQWVTPQVS